MELIVFFIKLLVNFAAAAILTFGIYKTRHNNRQLAVSMLMLNLFVFSIMCTLTTDNFGLQAGLGLFAILSIFRFRSENFKQLDIAYFFGAVALATINGITPIGPLLYVINGLIIGTALLVDLKGTKGSSQTLEVTLDHIPPYLFNETDAQRELGMRFGVPITTINLQEIDYVKDTAKIQLQLVPNAKTNNTPLFTNPQLSDL